MADDPYFKAGYHVDRYYELEEDFLQALKHTPLEIYNTPEERKKAKSVYLADLLLRIGSSIDINFKKMIMSNYTHLYDEKLTEINKKRKEKGKDPKSEVDLKFNDYMNLEKVCKLSDYKVIVIQTRESLTPFKEWKSGETPTWWSSYNKVKHNANLDEAHLENVLQALSALFLLICKNKHSVKMLNYNYLCINPQFKQKILLGIMKEHKHDIITKIFISPIKS